MTVSIQVTTNQKDPVYKPPPPTVARPAASTATASAILTLRPTHTTQLTPIHSLVKDLLQKQRLVLSWSSLRLIISRGIYPSSSFLTTPGSTSLPSLPSTQAYYKNTTNDKARQVAQTETIINAPSPTIMDSIVPSTITLSTGDCTRSSSSPDSQRSDDPLQQHKTTPVVTKLDQAIDTDLQEVTPVTIEGQEESMDSEGISLLVNEDMEVVEDHPHEDTTNMEIDPLEEEDLTMSALEPSVPAPTLNNEASLFTGPMPATQEMDDDLQPSTLVVDDSQTPTSTDDCQSPITSSTPLPQPSTLEVDGPQTPTLTDEYQSAITSNTLLPQPSNLVVNDSQTPTSTDEYQSAITSSTPLPRPSATMSLHGSTLNTVESPSPITGSTLLPRPSRTIKVPSNVPAQQQIGSSMDICESPINSSTPLPRPSIVSNSTVPLRNSNPPIPPKRNSKLPIRASSSTPSGLLSSKRPGASPTVNKRRAITSIFSSTNPTPVPTSPSTSETKTSRMHTRQASPITPPSRNQSLLTKMDHVLPSHTDEEEEERPKPISRKEKLARQAKRAEQIKFYRVREERDAREQRLAARRRLMAPKNDGNISDSGSTSSSSSTTHKRGKGVKFNLNRNRVIEIQQDTVDGASGRSRIPHSIR